MNNDLNLTNLKNKAIEFFLCLSGRWVVTTSQSVFINLKEKVRKLNFWFYFL